MPNPKGNPGNLRPWRPGQSGNPGGRPKGRQSLATLLRDTLDKTELCGQALPEGRTAAEMLVEAMVLHAIRGKIGFAQVIFNRIEGKASDQVPGEDDRKAYVSETPDTLWPAEPA